MSFGADLQVLVAALPPDQGQVVAHPGVTALISLVVVNLLYTASFIQIYAKYLYLLYFVFVLIINSKCDL